MNALKAPTTLPEFQHLFTDEDACRAYLFKVRWPDGFICPKCGSTVAYEITDRPLIECRNGHQTSVTAGTVMHRSKMPICTWFQAAYLVTTLTPGISALQFQRQLGIRRYETAFNLLHKLRSALVAPEREKLKGEVQIDEAFVGGEEAGVPGRGAQTKALVVVAVEVIHYMATKRLGQHGHERESMPDGAPELVDVDGKPGAKRKRAGRVRMSVIPNATAKTLLSWVQANVEPGSTVYTDGWAGYAGLAKLGYGHQKIVQSHKGVKTQRYLPMIHLMISNLKRWLIGTHKGAVLPKHLQAYLNEFTFRFNRRFWRGPAFLRALGLAVKAPHGVPEYETLYEAGEEGGWEHPDPKLDQQAAQASKFVRWLGKRRGVDPRLRSWATENPEKLIQMVKGLMLEAAAEPNPMSPETPQ